MKKFLSISLILLSASYTLTLTSSCKKTVTRTIVDTFQHAWQPLPLINSYGQAVWSSINVGDTSLYVGGSAAVIQVPVNHQPFNNLFGWPLPGTSLTAPVQQAPFLNGTMSSYTTATTFFVVGVPVQNNYNIVSYTPVYTPGEYSRFQQYSSLGYQGSPATSAPLIRGSYALLPIETIGGGGNQQVRFDLLSFDSTKIVSPLYAQQTPAVKKLVVTAAQSTLGFQQSNYLCAVYYDKFFVAYGGQFFRIDTTGNIKAFGYTPAPYQKTYGINNMFTIGNTLFVNSGGIIFASTDKGENWTVFNDLSGSASSGVIYRNVRNDLYATLTTLSMQIWKVVRDGNSFNFSELNNDGLESNLVTSITRCGKFVFATTPTGVYYRDTVYFNQLKIPIR